MKIYQIPINKLLLPDYIIECLKKLKWLESNEKSIKFFQDDFILVLYGVRGSTAFSGPHHIRYGSNTTAYQIWSPKFPQDVLYLGDGGSGILEIDKYIMKKLFSNGINPFTSSQQEVARVISKINNLYTHYHYDHLHMGAPLAAIFNSNTISKTIIGGDNPKLQFTKTFKRPAFPRDFGEIQASYSFQEIHDPRASIIIFTPNGQFRVMSTSDFNNFISSGKPQIKHNKIFYNIEECMIVRCYVTDHPDPCISYRYENYDSSGEITMAVTFMTDHEIRETDDRNSYFLKHVNNSNVVYFDGQYTNDNFIPGFGHGRVEVIGKTAVKLHLENIIIGHHDPQRKDDEIDQMVECAKDCYEKENEDDKHIRFVGAADRMMVFVPGKERKRDGVVFGRMNLDKGQEYIDDIGPQSFVVSKYHGFDLTQTYMLDDLTTSFGGAKTGTVPG